MAKRQRAALGSDVVFSPFREGMPPIWREARLGLELTSLLRDPVFEGARPPVADGQPVLLLPGYMAGDDSLGMMASWLGRTGRRSHRARIGWNVGCAAQMLESLLTRLEEIADRDGPVAIVGQSRGGLFARVLAVRRPQLVSGIVTLGSAHLDPLAVHPLVRLQIHVVGLLGTLGTPGLFSASCLWGDCCAEVSADLAGPFPQDVGFVSVYSRSDGIIDWRTCLDPAARCVEINSSHCGMSAHPEAYRQLTAALSEFAGRPSQPAAAQARAI
jgi:pimeloyl-ACP methyl ester carboxylesterase